VSTPARLAEVRYTGYTGPRTGRTAALWSLARWSALRALGARRGWRAKLIPGGLIAIAFAPALVVLVLHAVVGSAFANRFPDLLPYRQYETQIGLILFLFAAVVVPELLCPDRRDNVLSLYFSTAVSRFDYVTGKIIAAFLPMLLISGGPVLLLYVENVLFATHPLAYVENHLADPPRIVAASIVVASYISLLALAVSSLTSRRAVAIGAYVGVVLVSTGVGGALAFGVGAGRAFQLLQLSRVPLQTQETLFPNAFGGDMPVRNSAWWLAWFAVCAASLVILAVRYVDAGNE
jgi:ABC-2 type transport system permease protein